MFLKSKIFVLWLIFPSYLCAQISFGSVEQGNVVSFLTKNKDYSDTKVKGSPYLQDEYQNGEIYVNDSLEVTARLRYNAYKSQIEVSDSNDTFFALLKRPYIFAEIGGREFKMLTYLDDKDLNRVAYFNPLNKGKIMLLFKPEIKLKRGSSPSTSYDREVPPQYIDVSRYYIKIGDEPARKVKLKKKTFTSILKDKKEQLSAFMKENELNLRNEKDVLLVLDFYNSI